MPTASCSARRRGELEDMKDKADHDGPETGVQTRSLRDALAAADIRRLVRASREADGDEVEQIRARYVDE